MERERPRRREKNVTGQGTGLERRGSDLGTGPAGSQDGYKGRGNDGAGGGGGSRVTRGAGLSIPVIIIAVLVFMFGGNLFGGGNSAVYEYGSANESSAGSFGGQYADAGGQGTGSSSGIQTASSSGKEESWSTSGAVGELNTAVASGVREKRTKIYGNGKDVVTIMLYLCGTDLESRSGMATADIQEMISSDLSENVNLIIYTGGCYRWKNKAFSNQTNQIYQIKSVNGRNTLIRLEDNLGALPMTKPSTLAGFIRYCAGHFPANRNVLILWDHGAGSVSGYGYDEKAGNGSMALPDIRKALREGGVSFDFIGFDACLMATVETALMLDEFADYMVASEETEPGIGWFYTDWLSALSRNPSMSTLEIGRCIVDDFVQTCARRTPGQGTTLSVVDLAELSAAVPSKLAAFSKSVTKSIQENDYRTISRARRNTREFARSSRIDQVDLVHLSKNVGSKEGEELSSVVCSAVKYNRTSHGMTNAYGLSIFFPFQSTKNVDRATKAYQEIGLGDDYSQAIRAFAKMEASGQAAAGGMTGSSPVPSLFGGFQGGGQSDLSGELIGQLLESFLGGDYGQISGLYSGNAGFLSDRAVTDEDALNYVRKNHFVPSALTWKDGGDGKKILSLSEEQWSLVDSLDLNLFYDDGEGYIDLGLDNIYSFDGDGNLVADEGNTWLSINGQIVPYYHLDTSEDGDYWVITGRVPAFLNGERVNIIVVFDANVPTGYVAGASMDYEDENIEAVAKNLTEIKKGDTLDFICDYYSYDGKFQDSYLMGRQMTVDGSLSVSDVTLPEGSVRLTYRLTDIYNQAYWTEAIDR